MPSEKGLGYGVLRVTPVKTVVTQQKTIQPQILTAVVTSQKSRETLTQKVKSEQGLTLIWYEVEDRVL